MNKIGEEEVIAEVAGGGGGGGEGEGEDFENILDTVTDHIEDTFSEDEGYEVTTVRERQQPQEQEVEVEQEVEQGEQRLLPTAMLPEDAFAFAPPLEQQQPEGPFRGSEEDVAIGSEQQPVESEGVVAAGGGGGAGGEGMPTSLLEEEAMGEGELVSSSRMVSEQAVPSPMRTTPFQPVHNRRLEEEEVVVVGGGGVDGDGDGDVTSAVDSSTTITTPPAATPSVTTTTTTTSSTLSPLQPQPDHYPSNTLNNHNGAGGGDCYHCYTS
eukprot:scaffold2334_cov160-Ochromonas_danica.AAC.1